MFNTVIEFVKCIVTGMSIGFDAVFRMLPIYQILDGLKTQMIAWILGIPVLIATLLLFGRFAVKHIISLFSKK